VDQFSSFFSQFRVFRVFRGCLLLRFPGNHVARREPWLDGLPTGLIRQVTGFSRETIMLRHIFHNPAHSRSVLMAKLLKWLKSLFNQRLPYCKQCKREETRSEWIEKSQCSFCFGKLTPGKDRDPR
jgi:hypothetical protein